MEALKKMKFDYVVRACIIIAIGVVLIIWAPSIIPLMAKMLAVLLFLIGAAYIMGYIFKKEKNPVDSGHFVAGIIVAAVGVWIFFNPGTFTDFIPKLFGVFILISGLTNLGQTISLVKYKYSYWWVSLVLAVVTLGLGCYLVFYATEAKELIVRLIGGFLAYDGVSNIWTASRLGKFEKLYEQAKRDAAAVDSRAEIVDVDDSAER